MELGESQVDQEPLQLGVDDLATPDAMEQLA